ncbi:MULTISPECIES: outer membrane protein assembly factor BamA [Rubrivivax]|uniref:Outer membrane protein assembly factor BamA n=1 Tax=Rubrivivax benzoatilyticus TaxID=316997 RepID=A0ABX0HTE9_9BURK|nr:MULTISPECIES: outer membrane protein assembly factor BamA [Rubrivivax]NHK98297.1 outer membrane protein assembly factor BamA [Rubrivivax benzoatilyticus]NHL23928.1 outer membrane protein assembly factor BamA [Rubrivivax benzoatilyticus]
MLPVIPTTPQRVACALFASAAVLATPAAHAVTPFVLQDIRIEGLQRTDPGTVFGALPFRIGDTYNDEKGAAALRALFGTGLFNDVRLEVDGKDLVVVVDERAIVASVNFVGLREFDSEPLIKSLRDSGIGEGLPFDKALIDRAEQEIKRQYLTRSLYGAEVVTTVTPLERNRVNVTFTMNEGDAAKITDIRIVGARAFKESTLLDLFDLTPGGWLTWYTKNDRYSRSKLNADLEKLRAWYVNRGYLEFNVDATQVTISPDKQSIAITISIREGQPYTVTAVRLEGDYLGKDDEFRALVGIRPGTPYNGDAVAETTRRITERFGLYGYAFARVEPRPEIDREKGQVVLVLGAEPQRRVYVRRVDVAGNARTRDEIIRREFRQLESSWYDGDRIKLSRDRVDRLGYFSDVAVDTTEVPGAPDQVDLTVKVEEKATGNLMLGAGYSNAERLSLTASIQQDNVFGSGNYLGFQINTSKSQRTLVLSTTDPYFTQDGISRALDIYYRTTRPYNSLGDSYDLATQGASVRFGVPFSEYDTVFFGIGAETTKIGTSAGIPLTYLNYRVAYGESSYSVPLTLGWQRDRRDSALVPSRGRYTRVNAEMSLVGDVRYVRTNLQYQEFWPMPWRTTLGANAELGWGEGIGGRPYPIFKNFYGGGLGTVRGFEQNSLGVVDPTGAYIGGSKRLNLNTSLYFPVPGTGNDKTLRIFAFGDAGNVWRDGETVDLGTLRASAGLGLSWISPVGPLQLSYAVPLRVERTDKIQRFQFQIGTSF